MCRLASLVLLLALVPSVQARVYSPRVLSVHTADAYSLKTFGQFHRWRDLKGDARAWEMYRYLADTRTGLFHMNEVLEGDDDLAEYRNVRDPIKIINVYGYGYCGILGPTMAGIAEGAGLGKARTLVLPGWHHVAAEVYYEDKWHYLDLDVRAAFRRSDGTLASLADARNDASLWAGRGPLFFPNDPLPETRKVYEKTAVDHYHGFHWNGHTMDYVLRQGETFTRSHTPQGGRWHHDEAYNKESWLVKLLEEEPRGPRPNHRHFTIHNHGNGRFVYQPNLTSASSDFLDGKYDADNIKPGKAGLTLVRPGAGHAIFEVRSPYVIVPKVGQLATTKDDSEASVVEVDANGTSLAISLDNGLTWRALETSSWPAVCDLTPLVRGKYGYLLKLSLRGELEQAVVRALKVTTWVQVAPASLPGLRKGVNHMEFRAGDHYGLPTRVVEVSPNANKPEELLKHLVQKPEDYDPARKTERIRGAIVAKVEAPPGSKIAWFCAGASFRTHQRAGAAKTRNTIAFAIDEPKYFQEIYRAAIPTDNAHWHYNADQEVKLDRPAKTLFVRYVGDPALNNIRIYAHCLDEPSSERAPSPIRIKHVWREKDQVKNKEFELKCPSSYEIVAEVEPRDEIIEFSVASR
ncbi:MAG: hypothetical protein L0Y72_15680 [Gemmataceae bacterium]|nr:hypothetical protein [Gemmataceae bacterium]MCI0740487.1 hypothetical protein [Gemmataceae bacterium]